MSRPLPPNAEPPDQTNSSSFPWSPRSVLDGCSALLVEAA
jgi:hypothetical protein